MKNLIVCFLTLSFAFSASGKPQLGTQHSHKAHVHGSAQLSIAFDGLVGKLEFESPAESTVGFEHLARTDEQKKKVQDTLDLLKSKMNEMVLFKSDLDCVLNSTSTKVETSQEGNHSETHATFDLVCNKSPKGTELTFQFTKFFPKLKKVEAQVLIDDLQKSMKVTKSPTILELK